MEQTFPFTPGLSFASVLEFAPLIETIVTEALAVRSTAVGESAALPVIKGVKIAGETWDAEIRLTRRG